MFSPKQFNVPTKIDFVSPRRSVVGSVFVDRVVDHPGGTSFYLGQLCVAILSDSYLLIGTRQLERRALRQEKPFRHGPRMKVSQRSPMRSSKVAVRRIA